MSRLSRFARLVSGFEDSDTVLVKHLSGQHDQSSHGSWAKGVDTAGGGSVSITPENAVSKLLEKQLIRHDIDLGSFSDVYSLGGDINLRDSQQAIALRFVVKDFGPELKAGTAHAIATSEAMKNISTEEIVRFMQDAIFVSQYSEDFNNRYVEELWDALEPASQESYADSGELQNEILIGMELSSGEIDFHHWTDVLPWQITDKIGLKDGQATPEAVQRAVELFNKHNVGENLTGSELAMQGTPSADLMVRRATVSALVNAWATTSNDSHPASLAIQEAVKKQFNLSDTADWVKQNDEVTLKSHNLFLKYEPLLRAYAQANYDNTQAFLRQENIKELTVYRGVTNATTIGGFYSPETPFSVKMRPISSWSFDPTTAESFSGSQDNIKAVVKATVPASQVLGIAGFGVGCLHEFETVLLGEKTTGYSVPTGENWSETVNKMVSKSIEINVDNSLENSDWIKSLGWDLPNEPKPFLIAIGGDWQKFQTLPAFKSMPEQLKVDVKNFLQSDFMKHLQGKHDQSSHGSWAGGVPDGSSDGYAYPIKTAYDNVIAGKEATVSPIDAPAWIDLMADRTDNPDLTNLEILGTQYFTKDNLGIKRDQMPQIPPDTQEAFIKAMQARGVRVDLVEVTPFGLHPIQAEISASKSGRIFRDMKKNGVGDTPITVSSDNYVIDGHHRWAAGLFLGLAPKTKNIKLKALRVDMPQEQLLDVVLAWNKTVGIVSIPLGAENDKKFVMKMLAFDIAVLRAKIKSTEVEKHFQGQHDQLSHGRRFNTTVDPSTVSSILESVKENGGLSIKLTDGSLPPDGYMVSRDSNKFGTVVKASNFFADGEGAKILGQFLIKNKSELGSGRAYLGVWHQTSTKVDGVDVPLPKSKQLVHLDVTDKIVNKKQAMSLGRRRDQISIWDVINFDEIETGGKGGKVEKGTSSHSTIPKTVEQNDGRGNHGLGKSGVGSNYGQVVVRVPVTRAGLAFAKHHAGQHDQSSHGTRYFHGSSVDLKVGDYLLPASQTGSEPRSHPDIDPLEFNNANYVYLTLNEKDAQGYASDYGSNNGFVYEVENISDTNLEIDPEVELGLTSDGSFRTNKPVKIIGKKEIVIKHHAGQHDQSSHGNWADGGAIAEGKYGQWGEKRQQEIISAESRGPSVEQLNASLALVEEDWQGMVQNARDYVDSSNNFTIKQELKDFIGDEQDSQTVEQLKDDFYENNATDILYTARDELQGELIDGMAEVFNMEHTGVCADGVERTFRSELDDLGIDEQDGSIKVFGNIYDENDDRVGEFERTFYPIDDGVEHDLFQFFEPDVNGGSGFGSEFIRNSENYYISHGINTVKVSTAWSGAYVWAKMGFDWDVDYNDAQTAQSALGDMRTQLQGYAQNDAPILGEIQSMMDRLDGNQTSSDYPTPYEVAMVGWNNGVDSQGNKLIDWPGKIVMTGSKFHYVKKLNKKPRLITGK